MSAVDLINTCNQANKKHSREYFSYGTTFLSFEQLVFTIIPEKQSYKSYSSGDEYQSRVGSAGKKKKKKKKGMYNQIGSFF